MATEKSPQKATLTIPEAARRLGIGVGLAYQLARTGKLPVLRLGRRLLVPCAALDAMLRTAASGVTNE